MPETQTAPSTMTHRQIADCVSATLDGLMEAVPFSQARTAGAAGADEAVAECTALAVYALALATAAAPAATVDLHDLLDEAGDRVGLLGVDLHPLAQQLTRRLAVDWPENLV